MSPLASPLLVVSAVALLATAYLFAHVALLASRRTYSQENRIAGFAFVLAWAALCTQAAMDAGRTLIPFLGADQTTYWLTFTRIKIFAAAVMIWGFGYYVGFLWSGRARFNTPLMAFAASHALLFLYLIERTTQLAVVSGTWSTRIQEVEPTLPTWGTPLVLAYFILPVTLIAGAYFLLSYRLPHRLQRLRAASIALCVIIYQTTTIYLANPASDPSSLLNPLLTLLVVGTALFAFIAYSNPDWLQRRITGPTEEPAYSPR